MTNNLINIGVKVSSEDAKFIASMRKSTKEVQQFSQKTKREFTNLGVAANKLKTAFLAITGGLVTFSKVHTLTKDFSSALQDLAAITGATGKDLKFLENAASELSKEMVRGGADILTAMKLVASAKPELLSNLPALRETTKEVLTLATAAKTDLPTAIKASITSLNQFGESAEETNRFVNVLAAGSQKGSGEVAEIGDALVKSGAAAKAAGLSFEQLNATLQILAANGIKNEVAGTAVNMILTKLSTNTNAKFVPSLVGWNQALQNTKDYLNNIKDPIERAIALKELFGEEAQKAARIILNENKAIAEMEKNITGTNKALEQAKVQMEGYANASNRAGIATDNFLRSIYASRAGIFVLNAYSQSLENLTERIENFGFLKPPDFYEQAKKINTFKGTREEFNTQRSKKAIQVLFGGNTSILGSLLMNQFKESPSSKLPDNLSGGFSSILNAVNDPSKLINSFSQSLEKINNLFKTKPLESFITPISMAKTAMQKFAEASKKAAEELNNTVSSMVQTRGSSAFNRILGGVRGSKEESATKIVRDPAFERNVAGIVDQVLKLPTLGKGTQKEFLEKKLPQQMQQLANMLGTTIRGAGGSGVGLSSGGSFSVVGDGRRKDFTEMIGIFQQLQKFVREATGQEAKVNLNIQVNASPDFITKVTSSQDNQNMINTTIGQLLEDTARADRR